MKAKLQTVIIEMTFNDAKKLKPEIQSALNDIVQQISTLGGDFNEAQLRETHPKINELLNILNINEKLPF